MNEIASKDIEGIIYRFLYGNVRQSADVVGNSSFPPKLSCQQHNVSFSRLAETKSFSIILITKWPRSSIYPFAPCRNNLRLIYSQSKSINGNKIGWVYFSRQSHLRPLFSRVPCNGFPCDFRGTLPEGVGRRFLIPLFYLHNKGQTNSFVSNE